MDYQYLSNFFIKEDIRGAIEYMSNFDEMNDIVAMYNDIFENEKYIKYDVPEKINDILTEYQKYFRDVFYCGTDDEKASESLIKNLGILIGTGNDETVTAEKIKRLFEKNGLHIQMGRTNGHYGPYVWKTTDEITYEVELPDCRQSYRVNILRDFIMCSWMSYLTFGEKGTKGWAGADGTINCVENAWDFDSDAFKISLLKHEAQHLTDMKKWPEIQAEELEYRAKLVEIMYSDDESIALKFINESDTDKKDNSHAVANARIASEIGVYIGKNTDELKRQAGIRFDMSTAELNKKYGDGIQER